MLTISRLPRVVSARRNPFSFMSILIVGVSVAFVASPSRAERETSLITPQQDRTSADSGNLAQVPEHGLGATKGCMFRCVGETMDCTATAVFLDDFDDALVIKEAFDEVVTGSGVIRVPPVGNLPITEILGNAICTDDGGPCNAATGANCALPCTIGPTEFLGSSLPGFIGNGRVRFAQDQYVIQPADAPGLGDTVFFVWEDLCNSGATSCPQTDLMTPAGSNTIVPTCDDGNDCTADTCFDGTCTNQADCLDDSECSGGDVCTMDTCTVDGCCESSPICVNNADCNDSDGCTQDVCLPSGCCQNTPLCPGIDNCNDSNVCTTDVCGDSGCCENTPECTSAADCNDNDECTSDSCSVDGCCDNTPLCETANDCDDLNECTFDECGVDGCCDHFLECMTAADCDDSDDCTSDTCSPDGCCQSDPICLSAQDCDDGNVCTTEECGPDGCCESIPDCTSSADCDDDNQCTGDICTAAGCCGHSDKVCSDGNPCTDDVCDRGLGCIFIKLDPLPEGCVNVPAMSEWATTILVLALGVMIAIRFGTAVGQAKT